MKEKIIAKLKSFGAAAYLGLAAILFAVVSLIVYAVYAAAVEQTNGLVIAMLVVGIVVEAAGLWLGIDYVTLACPALFGTAFGGLAYCVYGTFVDLVNNVNFFGDVSKLDVIIAAIVFMGLTAVCSVVANFMRLRKKQAEPQTEKQSNLLGGKS